MKSVWDKKLQRTKQSVFYVFEHFVSRHGIKKERPSQNALAYFIIMFYREELIACAIDLNSSSDNFSFGLENSISDSFWIGIK